MNKERMHKSRQTVNQAAIQRLMREFVRKEIDKILTETSQQTTMSFGGNEVQDLFNEFKKLPSSHLRKTSLDSKACKRLKVPSGSIMYEYTWGANSAAAIASGDKMVAMMFPSDRAHDLSTELEKLIGVKDWRGTLDSLASSVGDAGYDDIYYFDSIAEATAPQQNPTAPSASPKQAAKSEPNSAPKASTPPAKQQPKAAPKQQPEKPENKPQPDQQEKPQDADAELASMTAGFIQKIKHSVGSPTPESLTTMITSLIQAWGLTSEDKLAILKTVRNTTVR